MKPKTDATLSLVLINGFLLAVASSVLINIRDQMVEPQDRLGFYWGLVVLHSLAYLNGLAMVAAIFIKRGTRWILPLFGAGIFCFFGSILGHIMAMAYGFSRMR